METIAISNDLHVPTRRATVNKGSVNVYAIYDDTAVNKNRLFMGTGSLSGPDTNASALVNLALCYLSQEIEKYTGESCQPGAVYDIKNFYED